MDMAKPIIRFKGYQDDWEQRKLSEFVDKAVDNRGKTPPLDDNGIHPLIEVAALGGVHPDYSKVEKYLNDDSFENNLRAYIKEGDILFTTVGSIGLVSLMDSREEAAIAQNIVAFRAKENFVPEYLYSLFSNEKNQYKAKRIVMGAVQPSIKVSQLVDVEYMLTQNVKEQQKIGEYFSNLDHLITLHQRKCDETKKLKKYMLQKMFPQNGEKVPEIRFSGFTDDWEQRKLSEIALQTYGGGTPKTANEEFWKGNIPWIQSSDLLEERLFNVKPRKYISQEAISKSSTKLVPQNSVAIVTRVGVGKLAFMPFSYATSQDFLSLSELKIEPEFAVYALYKMMRLVSNEVQGTSIKGITKDELLAKEILIPDCEEQKKIGAYLHNLDDLITLHQRELENLQNIKKFMLEKMFV